MGLSSQITYLSEPLPAFITAKHKGEAERVLSSRGDHLSEVLQGSHVQTPRAGSVTGSELQPETHHKQHMGEVANWLFSVPPSPAHRVQPDLQQTSETIIISMDSVVGEGQERRWQLSLLVPGLWHSNAQRAQSMLLSIP